LTEKGRRQTAEGFYGRVTAQLPVCHPGDRKGVGVSSPLQIGDLEALVQAASESPSERNISTLLPPALCLPFKL